MPEEPNAPVVETPPPETPPAIDAVDESGVPYKNRAAEFERKFKEQEELNRQYQIALGAQQRQQAPVAPVAVSDDLDELEKQFDEPTRKYIDRKIRKVAAEVAEQTGYKFVSQAGVQNELQSDPEIMQEAQRQYQALATNPLWRSADDVLKQEKAVDAAKAVVFARRAAKGKETQTEEARVAAERALANGASLPGTRGAPPQQPTNREEAIKAFMANPEKQAMFEKMSGVDPNTEAGKRRFRRAAEIDFDTHPSEYWGGKTRVAINVMQEEGNRR